MIYLDNAATTKIRAEVVDAMAPYLSGKFGNPSSLYSHGRQSRQAINHAREQVASFLGVSDEEHIIFTSGGSEANSLAIVGHALQLAKARTKGKMLHSGVEHECVLRSYKTAQIVGGFRIGKPNIANLLNGEIGHHDGAVRLVSVMYANNELPLRFPVKEIAERVHDVGGLFHTDCVQAASAFKIDVCDIDCDFASISGHKIHGPKGVGALYVKDKRTIHPLIGGSVSQEFGKRGGTENVANIVGLGAACEYMQTHRAEIENRILQAHQDFLEAFVAEATENGLKFTINGNEPDNMNVLSITIHGVDSQTLILYADTHGISISAGSACHGTSIDPSHVLTELGLAESAFDTIRVSFTDDSELCSEDYQNAAKAIVKDAVALWNQRGLIRGEQ